jgi:hypothetical protein
VRKKPNITHGCSEGNSSFIIGKGKGDYRCGLCQVEWRKREEERKKGKGRMEGREGGREGERERRRKRGREGEEERRKENKRTI